MKYCSTRGAVNGLSFEDVLFSGFLADGGMALPESIPQVHKETLMSWSGKSYKDLLLEIIPCFVSDDELPFDSLQSLVNTALSTFDTSAVAPIAHLSNGLNVLEMFHGRTWAFKDLALSFVGQLFDYFSCKQQKHLMLIVGTSGDTGSSAIEAVRDLKWVDIIVILPRNRCTKIQELQMTTVKSDNVFVFRADGTSDDLDLPIKKLFADVEFARKHNLCSANSLNWARIMVQIVHYFYAYIKMCPACDQELEVIVPTGGGGNIAAGLIARRMGLPVKLVCAVNVNDIVARMVSTGLCELNHVTPSLAPAMDMQFAYNFERAWYLCSERNSELIAQMMTELELSGKTKLPHLLLTQMQSEIKSFVLNDEGIKQTLKRCWDEDSYLLCPHTAVAVAYFYSSLSPGGTQPGSKPSICLATASPVKFPEALTQAGLKPVDSPRIRELLAAPTCYTDMEVSDDWEKILRQKIEEMTANFYARQSAEVAA